MTKKFCPVCGEELTKKDIEEGICSNCGAYLEEPSYDIEADLQDEEFEEEGE